MGGVKRIAICAVLAAAAGAAAANVGGAEARSAAFEARLVATTRDSWDALPTAGATEEAETMLALRSRYPVRLTLSTRASAPRFVLDAKGEARGSYAIADRFNPNAPVVRGECSSTYATAYPLSSSVAPTPSGTGVRVVLRLLYVRAPAPTDPLAPVAPPTGSCVDPNWGSAEPWGGGTIRPLTIAKTFPRRLFERRALVLRFSGKRRNGPSEAMQTTTWSASLTLRRVGRGR